MRGGGRRTAGQSRTRTASRREAAVKVDARPVRDGNGAGAIRAEPSRFRLEARIRRLSPPRRLARPLERVPDLFR